MAHMSIAKAGANLRGHLGLAVAGAFGQTEFVALWLAPPEFLAVPGHFH